MLVVYSIAVLIFSRELVMADDDQCTDFQLKSPFLPGESCEGIYNKNPESQTKPGYYWILTREYCEMNYTGSSCVEICNNYPETCDKPGYYHINDKWTYCCINEIAFNGKGDCIPTCAGVGGGWRRIVKVNMSTGDSCPSGWHKEIHSGLSYCRINNTNDRNTCTSAYFSTNGTSYQRVCGRARGYQKGRPVAFWVYHHYSPTIDHN